VLVNTATKCVGARSAGGGNGVPDASTLDRPDLWWKGVRPRQF